MRELPRGLRRYLWAIDLACIVLVIAQLGVLLAQAMDWRGPPVALSALAVFVLLAYAGERATLQVSGSIDLSLATPVHIATILLFPLPFPLLITLLAVLASQVSQPRSPLYKRVFNVCHATLTVGLSNILVSFVAVPTQVLQPGRIVAAAPVLVTLMVSYYVLDVGPLIGVLGFVESRPPWLVWWQTNRRTLFPELATGAIGVLAAVAWQYDHVLLVLFVLPVVALRVAFSAIAQAENAQHAAEEAQLRAEQALRVRDEFLTAASHDLRTPLTSIMGYAEVMQMRLEREAAAGARQLRTQVRALIHAARRMVATVEEITDAAQLQIGHRLTLSAETIDVGDLVRAAAAIVSSGAPKGAAKVIVDAAAGVTLIGDRLRLERVLQNIIGNAVKYSPQGTPVHVGVEQCEQQIVITVRDQGVGIPADELPHIFTHFYRASTSIGIKGTGVGLAGSRSIVEQHGGHIAVDSTVGLGTTVTISLPRTPSNPAEGA